MGRFQTCSFPETSACRLFWTFSIFSRNISDSCNSAHRNVARSWLPLPPFAHVCRVRTWRMVGVRLFMGLTGCGSQDFKHVNENLSGFEIRSYIIRYFEETVLKSGAYFSETLVLESWNFCHRDMRVPQTGTPQKSWQRIFPLIRSFCYFRCWHPPAFARQNATTPPSSDSASSYSPKPEQVPQHRRGTCFAWTYKGVQKQKETLHFQWYSKAS